MLSAIASILRDCIGSDVVWIGSSLLLVLVTIAVGIGLYLEYERHEIRIFHLAKTRLFDFKHDFPVKKQYAVPKKSLGSFLVVWGVILEAVFAVLSTSSALIRETDSQARILALQKEMLPRHVNIFLHAIGRLQRFPQMRVTIRTVQDTESRRLLFDLTQLLMKCDWQVDVRQEESLSLTPDGIEIVYRAADAKGKAPEAAKALSAYLDLPEVAVINEVGVYPSENLLHWWPSNGPNDVSPLQLVPNSVTVFIGLRPVSDRPRNWFQPEKP